MALPLPLTRSNATQALLLDLPTSSRQLNQETLRVTGLEAGQYTLSIDGDAVDTFSPEALENGINLADYETPMLHQAQRVSWLVRDRDETHYIHLRMRVRNADTGEQAGKPDVMQAFENSLEDSIYEAAVPKPHVFRLTPVATGIRAARARGESLRHMQATMRQGDDRRADFVEVGAGNGRGAVARGRDACGGPGRRAAADGRDAAQASLRETCLA